MNPPTTADSTRVDPRTTPPSQIVPLRHPGRNLAAVIDVPELGRVTVDVAWGGMFYVIADVRQFEHLALSSGRGREIARLSSLILGAAQDQLSVEHPDSRASASPFPS